MTEKRKRGRPRKPDGQAHTGMFAVRLSDDERALLDKAAQHAGMPVTKWARGILISSAISMDVAILDDDADGDETVVEP